MGTITVKNLSSLTDSAALVRVSIYITGSYDIAVSSGEEDIQIIEIKHNNGVYTVTDK